MSMSMSMSMAIGRAPRPAANAPPSSRHPRPLLPGAVRRHLGWISGLGALWFAGFALLVAHTDRPGREDSFVDRRLFEANLHHHQRLFADLADLGDPGRFITIIAIVLIICLLGRSWRAAVASGLSLAVVLVAVEVIGKPLIQARLSPGAPFSFPSGHTASATCLGTMAILLLGRSEGPLRLWIPRPLRGVLTVAGALAGPVIGAAMIAIGAHSFTDVLGALPLAATLTLLVCAGVDQLFGRGAERSTAEIAVSPDSSINHTPMTSP